MNTDEIDIEEQLKGMTDNDVCLAYIFAFNELERRGIDPEELEFVSPERH